MEKEVKITAYAPAKSGVSAAGNQWTMQDVVLTWEEENRYHDVIKQNCLVTLSGKIKQEMLDDVVKNGTVVNVRLYFDTRLYNDRLFSSNRAYLPEEFYEKN